MAVQARTPSRNPCFVDPSGNDCFDFVRSGDNLRWSSRASRLVADTPNNRLVEYDPRGKYLTEWSTYNQIITWSFLPWGVTIDSIDNVVVAAEGTWVAQFTRSGGLIALWGGPSSPVFGTGFLSAAVDSSGNIYVADEVHSDVQVITSGGQLGRIIGTRGTGPGQLESPTGIAVDGPANV